MDSCQMIASVPIAAMTSLMILRAGMYQSLDAGTQAVPGVIASD